MHDASTQAAIRTTETMRKLGAPIPGDLDTALEALEAGGSPFATPSRFTGVEFDTCAPEDVEGIIQGMADERARAAAEVSVRQEALQRLGRRLGVAWQAARPRFAQHLVAPFREAVADLEALLPHYPSSLSPEALLEAGGEAVEAYHRGREIVGQLDGLAGVRRSLGVPDPEGVGAFIVNGTRWAECDDSDTVYEVHEILAGQGGALDPWASILRLPGVRGLVLRATPEEHLAAIRALPMVSPGESRFPLIRH